MILKINHLFNLIFILPLFYLLFRAFQHIYLDYKKKSPKVDFDDLVKQKEQLLMLTLGKAPAFESCKTHLAYQNFDSPDKNKILEIFKGLQWGEGPFQRDVTSSLHKNYGINSDFLTITNAIKFLINNELLTCYENLPGYERILNLTGIIALYKNLLGGEQEVHQKNFADKKKLTPNSVQKALNFQIQKGLKKNLGPKEIDQGLIELITKGHDIIAELLLYAKVVNKLSTIKPLRSKGDLKGALEILGLNDGSSKKDIKKRYRDLALAQHPDTLSNEGVPQGLLKQACENFNQINLAYKLLMEKIS